MSLATRGSILLSAWMVGGCDEAPDPCCDVAIEVGDGDASADASASEPEPDPAPAGCGAIGALADDFERAFELGFWDTSGGAAAYAHLADGRAVVTLGPVPARGGFTSKARVPLTGGSVRVEVVAVPDTKSQASVTFRAVTVTDDALAISEQSGLLSATVTSVGHSKLLGSVPYDAAVHRWWRIGEADGVVMFETSPDDVTWTKLASGPISASFDDVRVELTAEPNQANTSPGEAVFDNVNGGRATAPWCPLSEWRDDFDGATWSSRWEPWQREGCDIVRGDGTVLLRPVPGLRTGCGFRSVQPLDVRDGGVTLEVLDSMKPTGGCVAQLQFQLENGDIASFNHVGRHFRMRLQVGTDVRTLAEEKYDEVQHRWWRLREHDGVIYWDSSPDTLLWTTHAAQIMDPPPRAAFIEIFVSVYETVHPPNVFRIDEMNLPPWP